jgi:hypothetical protein
MPPLPGVDNLPNRPEMPAVLTMDDGQPVRTAKQWDERRGEMRQVLEYYAVGQAPPPPGNVKGHVMLSQTILNGKVKYRLVHLTFGPAEKLSLDIGIFTPIDGGPFVTLISPSGTPPGAIPLPRLRQGPTQGRGLDVLLVVEGGAQGGVQGAGTSGNTLPRRASRPLILHWPMDLLS